MFLLNWLIFFSSFSFGILLGLIFSDTHRSLEIIYARTIPLVIILQLLFGGGFIDINSVRPGGKNYTLLFSDFMVSRWGYEAAMVNQFRNNDYERRFYDTDRSYALSEINTLYILPAIKTQLNYCKSHVQDQSDTLNTLLNSINYTLDQLAANHDIFPYENIHHLTMDDFNETLADDAAEYIEYLEFYFFSQMERSEKLREQMEKKIADSLGTDYLNELRTKCYNYAVANKVLKKDLSESIKYYRGVPLQTRYPVYQYPHSNFGRAPMFIPEKQFSGERIDTIEFNISIIWLINLLLYVILITNLTGLRKKLFRTDDQI
jgi:hypothetical protein